MVNNIKEFQSSYTRHSELLSTLLNLLSTLEQSFYLVTDGSSGDQWMLPYVATRSCRSNGANKKWIVFVINYKMERRKGKILKNLRVSILNDWMASDIFYA